jgi:hypothetical protein
LKWILIEASWPHIRNCPQGHLAEVFKDVRKMKGNNRSAIKVAARKLVNVVWSHPKANRKTDQIKKQTAATTKTWDGENSVQPIPTKNKKSTSKSWK